jgi:putative ATPase
LSEVVGQDHLLGENGLLNKLADSGKLHSMILWGPPGVGKTTLARLLADAAGMPVRFLSAIESGVKDIRAVLEEARVSGAPIVLFIDEIHRFNKGQQDALLGAVEEGVVILIGATTENPSFEINKALLSRSRVYTLKALDVKGLQTLLDRGLKQFSGRSVEPEAAKALMAFSGGDGRRLLNLLEGVLDQTEGVVTEMDVRTVAQTILSSYDKDGEQHYDIISAFIKSVRGSDPDAAVYWLARMVDSGEDVLFIARRLIILASEDIGLANPNALLLANATFDAVNKIGWPESRIILSQCTVYLANSAKSNASYMAINKAQEAVKMQPDLPVPLHLRNAPTGLMKQLGYGAGYKYPHDYPNSQVEQEYLPKELKTRVFYNPPKK